MKGSRPRRFLACAYHVLAVLGTLIEVETNTRHHFFVLGPRRVRYEVDSPRHRGTAEVLTYEPEEPLGTKLRALYQRKKGRDLFDLSEALTRLNRLDANSQRLSKRNTMH